MNKYLEKIANVVDERIKKERRIMGIAMSGNTLAGGVIGGGLAVNDLYVKPTLKHRIIGGAIGSAAGLVTGAITGDVINKLNRKR